MPTLRSRFRLVFGTAIGLWLTLATSAVYAASPTWNRDLGAAPRAANEPDAASLSITVRTCPPGYDLAALAADFLADCREPAGDTNFQLSQAGVVGPSASTGTSGDAPQASTVQFTNLSAGTITITALAPPEIAGAFVGKCTSDVRSFESYPFTPFAVVVDGAATLQLIAGETLMCDWYQISSQVNS